MFGVAMSPWSAAQVVTFGVKHIKFWTQAGGGLTYRQVVLGNKFRQVSAYFLSKPLLFNLFNEILLKVTPI